MMSTRTRFLGIVAGVFALGALAGCGRLAVVSLPGASVRPASADPAALEGVWVGQIWETPTDYFQGVRRVTVNITSGGAWTATIGGVECASGVATMRHDLVILTRRAPAGAPCVPHSLEMDGGHMWGEFTTSFNRRAATAAIDLVRVRERAQEAASASSPR
jgi:hypothetical protein